MEGSSSLLNVGDDQLLDYNMDLPPGFRFHPTDEEIISHYLTPKVMNGSFSAIAVGEVDLNKCEPWDLPKKATMGGKEWYFFCQRDRKYPTGMRTNRATESGYWKATGKDKEIYKKGRSGSLVGMKKTLVFYKGRAPKGEKTNWVMHEYRLEGQFSYYNFPKPVKDEWVVSRVFHKSSVIKSSPIICTSDYGLTRINSSSFVNDLLMDFTGNSLPPLIERQADGNNSSFMDGTTEDDMVKGKATASSSSPRSSEGGDYNSLSFYSPDHYLIKNHFTPDFHFHPQIPLSDNTVLPINQYSLGSSEKSMLLAMKNRANKDDMEYQRKCKIEQWSSNSNNQSMIMNVSQDTGFCTDNMTTAETSSVISMKEMGISSTSYEELDQDPNSVCPISDNLDYLWNY